MDADTVVWAVVLTLPALFAVALLGGAVAGWQTRRDNWAIRVVFPRRHTHPALTIIRRVRRTAVAGTGTLALSATTLLVPMHWGPVVVSLVSLPMMFVRVGMMKATGSDAVDRSRFPRVLRPRRPTRSSSRPRTGMGQPPAPPTTT